MKMNTLEGHQSCRLCVSERRASITLPETLPKALFSRLSCSSYS